MADKYDHKKIEEKWRKKWEKSKLYKTEEDSSKEKCYVLDMLPYTSGDGLHVGHPKGYIATDIYSRWKSMNGFSVLHPMGWDAFGLPAENYAIKNKVHPEIAVKKNIKRFKDQLSILGFNYDWDREINTSDPAYYKWTQWIFLKLFEKGLAYESWEPINWCPFDKTGLANEDVENGRCERCGTLVEKKPMRQWVLRITDYAEKLLEGLEGLDWPTSIKESQRNWIGRSEGVNFKCKVKDLGIEVEMFNSVPQTFRAETFTVIAPEHPLVKELVKGTKNEKAVLDFVEKLKQKRLLKDYDTDKEMEGIFSGRYVENFAGSGRDLPIWVASYVVADYGTGIVNASAHDTRDFAFAKKFNIPLHPVAEPLYIRDIDPKLPLIERDAITALVEHWSEKKYLILKWKKVAWHTFITGGIEKGQIPEEAAKREILEETGYIHPRLVKYLGIYHSKFYHEPKKENRFGHFRTFHFKLTDGEKQTIAEDEKDKHEALWMTKEEALACLHVKSMQEILLNLGEEERPVVKNGILTEPPEFKGREWGEVREDIINFIIKNGWGSKKINYKLKDWVFSRQRYWGEPIPIIHCEHCKKQKQKVLIIHGFEGDPNEGWKPWLKGELAKEGFDVMVPKLPNAHHPNFKEIFGFLEKEVKDFGEDDVIIGHSMGAHFALKLAEKKKFKKIILVAPAYGGQNLPYENWNSLYPESDNKALEETLKGNLVDFSKMRVSDRVAILGTDDPDIPIETASGLDGMWKIIKLDGVGHMAHLTEFSELFKLVVEAKNTGVVPVPEKDLPVELPEVDHYEPTDTGESPLANIPKWVNVKCPKCGGKARRETNTMPQWAGSSWYYLRYEDPKNNKVLVDDKKEKYWSPVDFYVGGAEHATRHLIYARFWHKFLFDIGLVHYPEPFIKLQNVGLIGGADGRKMSKRFGNVVNPDEMVELYGADTFRLYEMFMGPFADAIPWSTEGMIGPRRFLEKVWRLQEKS